MRVAASSSRPAAYMATVAMTILLGACISHPESDGDRTRSLPYRRNALMRFLGTYRGAVTPGAETILVISSGNTANSDMAELTITARNASTEIFTGTVDTNGAIRCAGRPDTDPGMYITGRIADEPGGRLMARGEWMQTNVGNGT